MNTAYALPPQPPLEAYEDDPLDYGDEVSGVHRRYTPSCSFEHEAGDEPGPVYLVLDDERYFVGVRFANGIIIADGWATALWRDGAPLQLLNAAAAWLRAHAV